MGPGDVPAPDVQALGASPATASWRASGAQTFPAILANGALAELLYGCQGCEARKFARTFESTSPIRGKA